LPLRLVDVVMIVVKLRWRWWRMLSAHPRRHRDLHGWFTRSFRYASRGD